MILNKIGKLPFRLLRNNEHFKKVKSPPYEWNTPPITIKYDHKSLIFHWTHNSAYLFLSLLFPRKWSLPLPESYDSIHFNYPSSHTHTNPGGNVPTHERQVWPTPGTFRWPLIEETKSEKPFEKGIRLPTYTHNNFWSKRLSISDHVSTVPLSLSVACGPSGPVPGTFRKPRRKPFQSTVKPTVPVWAFFFFPGWGFF